MGAVFEVYNEQGYGMAEEIYQESLEIELGLRGIPFRAKQPVVAQYKGVSLSSDTFPTCSFSVRLLWNSKRWRSFYPSTRLNFSTTCASLARKLAIS